MAAKTGKKGGTAKKSSHKKSKKIVRGEKRVVPVDAKVRLWRNIHESRFLFIF